jgi:hypothetical protein
MSDLIDAVRENTAVVKRGSKHNGRDTQIVIDGGAEKKDGPAHASLTSVDARKIEGDVFAPTEMSSRSTRVTDNTNNSTSSENVRTYVDRPDNVSSKRKPESVASEPKAERVTAEQRAEIAKSKAEKITSIAEKKAKNAGSATGPKNERDADAKEQGKSKPKSAEAIEARRKKDEAKAEPVTPIVSKLEGQRRESREASVIETANIEPIAERTQVAQIEPQSPLPEPKAEKPKDSQQPKKPKSAEVIEARRKKDEAKQERKGLQDAIKNGFGKWNGDWLGNADKEGDITDAAGTAVGGIDYAAFKEISSALSGIGEDENSLAGILKKKFEDKTGITAVKQKAEDAKAWAVKKVTGRQAERSQVSSRAQGGRQRDRFGRYVPGQASRQAPVAASATAMRAQETEESAERQEEKLQEVVDAIKDSDKNADKRNRALQQSVGAGGEGGVVESIIGEAAGEFFGNKTPKKPGAKRDRPGRYLPDQGRRKTAQVATSATAMREQGAEEASERQEEKLQEVIDAIKDSDKNADKRNRALQQSVGAGGEGGIVESIIGEAAGEFFGNKTPKKPGAKRDRPGRYLPDQGRRKTAQVATSATAMREQGAEEASERQEEKLQEVIDAIKDSDKNADKRNRALQQSVGAGGEGGIVESIIGEAAGEFFGNKTSKKGRAGKKGLAGKAKGVIAGAAKSGSKGIIGKTGDVLKKGAGAAKGLVSQGFGFLGRATAPITGMIGKAVSPVAETLTKSLSPMAGALKGGGKLLGRALGPLATVAFGLPSIVEAADTGDSKQIGGAVGSVAGGLGGAAAGAALVTMVLPGVGTFIGGFSVVL